MSKLAPSHSPLSAMPESFRFEVQGAYIPILGARWDGDDPHEAEVFFQNESFLKQYGDLVGQRMEDVFETVLRGNEVREDISGHGLLAALLEKGEVRHVQGALANKRVELFARVQENTEKTIQVIVFDTTYHYFDTLTGIPGRALFFDRLKLELLRAVREKAEVHLCFIDLDNFKPVNDQYGHHVGDIVLREVAQRLQRLIRRHETVARLGGDEFVIMLSGQDIEPLAFAENKILPLIASPYVVNKTVIDSIGACIGVASFPWIAAKADELVSYADDAMYVAKAEGRNRVVLFKPGMENVKHR